MKLNRYPKLKGRFRKAKEIPCSRKRILVRIQQKEKMFMAGILPATAEDYPREYGILLDTMAKMLR